MKSYSRPLRPFAPRFLLLACMLFAPLLTYAKDTKLMELLEAGTDFSTYRAHVDQVYQKQLTAHPIKARLRAKKENRPLQAVQETMAKEALIQYLDQTGYARKSAIYFAVYHGQSDILKDLLQLGAEPKIFDVTLEEHLNRAIRSGTLPTARTYLRAGIPPSLADAFSVAVALNQPDLLEELLEAVVRPDRKLAVQVAFRKACRSIRALETMGERLLVEGAEINLPETSDDPSGAASGRTAFAEALERNDLQVMEFLFKRGARVAVAKTEDAKFLLSLPMDHPIVGEFLSSPLWQQEPAVPGSQTTGGSAENSNPALNMLLWEAVKAKNLAWSKLLLSRGAKASLANKPQTETLYTLALTSTADNSSNLPLIEMLIQAGADPHFKTADGETGLSVAARAESHSEGARAAKLKIMSAMLQIQSPDPSYSIQRALYHCIRKGTLESVELLHQRGGNLDFVSDFGTHSLDLAITNKHPDIALYIINTIRRSYGNSAGTKSVLYAAIHDAPEVVSALLNRGARGSELALFEAVSHGRTQMFEQLISAGARPNVLHPETQFSLLRTAAALNQLEPVQLLVSKGLDPNLVDPDGISPLAASIQIGAAQMVAYFLQLREYTPESMQELFKWALQSQSPSIGPVLELIGSRSGIVFTDPDHLIQSVQHRSFPSMGFLLSKGASPEESWQGTSALLEAARLYSKQKSSWTQSLLDTLLPHCSHASHAGGSELQAAISLLEKAGYPQLAYFKKKAFYQEKIAKATSSTQLKTEKANLLADLKELTDQGDTSSPTYQLLQQLKAEVNQQAQAFYYQEKQAELSKDLSRASRSSEALPAAAAAQPTETNPTPPCGICLLPLEAEETLQPGPAGCACVMCNGCREEFASLERQNTKDGTLSQCSLCHRITTLEWIRKFGKPNQLQLEPGEESPSEEWTFNQIRCLNQKNSNYRSCPTPGCLGGTVIDERSARHICLYCDYNACLRCNQDHEAGSCSGTEEHRNQMRLILEQGRKTGSKIRPCVHCCKIINKYDGCNSLRCQECGEKMHWNYGKDRLDSHDFLPGKMHYFTSDDPKKLNPILDRMHY